MRVLAIIAMGLLLAGCTPSPASLNGSVTCHDSDGFDIYRFGFVNDSDFFQGEPYLGADICAFEVGKTGYKWNQTGTHVQEWICTNDQTDTRQVRCAYGCVDGICLNLTADQKIARLEESVTALEQELHEAQKTIVELNASKMPADWMSKVAYSDDLEYIYELMPDIAACHVEGGTWRTFSNGCVDFCGAGPACSAAMTPGCDCGPSKCWNGTACI